VTRPERPDIGEVLRFLVAGGANTITAYGVYLVLLRHMRYEFAYAIGYGVGITVAYMLSAAFVFRRPMHVRSAARFPLVYLVQFLASLLLLRAAVEIFGIPRGIALAVSIAATMPLTFLMSRWVIRRE
jgi:putative flippase GtrA